MTYVSFSEFPENETQRSRALFSRAIRLKRQIYFISLIGVLSTYQGGLWVITSTLVVLAICASCISVDALMSMMAGDTHEEVLEMANGPEQSC